MSTSFVTYSGTGTQTDFTFPFNYLDKTDVFVFVNGVSSTFTWLNSSSIRTTSAPIAGTAVQIRRITQKAVTPVNFTDGSVLLEADLDTLALYSLYQAQENSDYGSRITAMENTILGISTGSGLPGTVYTQILNGDGTTRTFTLGATPAASSYVDVYLSGIYQANATFAVVGTVLTFTEAPPRGTANVEVKISVGLTLNHTDASLVTYQPAGTGAVATNVQTKLRGSVSVTDFGAATTNTNAQNKTALQLAIAATDAAGGGTVVVTNGIDYGFKNTDITTYPSFAGIVNDVVVIDNGIGDADGSGNKTGAQVRTFYGTAQTIPFGMHDGNGTRIYGSWHPYYSVANTANLAPVGNPSRLASDNRRASFLISNDGQATYRLGQGTLAGASYTNEELSNFVLEHYQATGDTLTDYAPLVIERKTGNWAFNLGSNSPLTSFHFKSKTAGYVTSIFESLATTCYHLLRNSNGYTQDVSLKNTSGDFEVYMEASGTAVSVDKTTRKTTLRSLALGVSPTSYGSTINIDAALGQIYTINATTGAGFNINDPSNSVLGHQITITIKNTSGGALGAVSWAALYKMATWTQPANGYSRSITFYYNGTNWIEYTRTNSDVPN